MGKINNSLPLTTNIDISNQIINDVKNEASIIANVDAMREPKDSFSFFNNRFRFFIDDLVSSSGIR